MIDILITLGKGSHWDDNELHYCLRSIEKNLSNFNEVWLIGEKPSWFTGQHIPFIERNTPARNVKEKIEQVCKGSELTEDFLFMNDDQFLLSRFNACAFPYFYDGTIKEYVGKRGIDPYSRIAKNTDHWLQIGGYPQLHYEVHAPMMMNKERFLKSVCIPEWSSMSFLIKSLYANQLIRKPKPLTHGMIMQGTAYVWLNHSNQHEKDFKTKELPARELFSTFPFVTIDQRKFLEETFPNKSYFEKT